MRTSGKTTTRRAFVVSGLKLSALGLVALSGGGYVAARLTDGRATPLLEGAANLTAEAQRMLYRVFDAVLSDMLPKGREEALLLGALARLDSALTTLPLEVQKELDGLFSMLAFAPTRLALSGRWSGWEGAGRAQVAGWLNALRTSRFALRRLIFITLHDLAASSFYGQPETWPLVGYGGPLLSGPGEEV